MSEIHEHRGQDALSAVSDGFGDAWSRMVDLLFTAPRARWGGWALWGLIVLLADPFGRGLNANLPVGDDAPGPLGGLGSPADWFAAWWIPLLVASALVALILVLLWIYVTCRFRFVLLEGVLTGSPRIRGVFGRTARAGGAYFLARLLLVGALVVALLPVVIVWLPVFRELYRGLTPTPGFTAFASLLWLVPVLLAFGVVEWWLYDFAVPCAWRSEGDFRLGLARAWRITVARPGAVALFALARLAAGIAGGLVACCGILVSAIVWIWPVALLVLLVVVSTNVPVLWIVSAPLLLVGLVFIAWFFSMLLAPLAVLWRSWSVAFLHRVDPGFPLWSEPSAPPAPVVPPVPPPGAAL